MRVPLGQFGRPHGVRGEIWFRPFNPDSPLIKKGRTIQVGRNPDQCQEYRVDAVRYDAKGIVIKLAEFFDRDQVRTLTGSTWYESREAFPELKADELYLVDLIGLDAVLDGGELIGPIVEIYDYGPYETLAIRRGGREVLVPYVDEFVSRIDLDRKTVVISPIEGLLDV